jgi:hypothetical protein
MLWKKGLFEPIVTLRTAQNERFTYLFEMLFVAGGAHQPNNRQMHAAS